MKKKMFEIQVEVEVEKKCGCGKELVWASIRPTKGAPYQFKTKQEAIKMAEMCYGGNFTPYKIV